MNLLDKVADWFADNDEWNEYFETLRRGDELNLLHKDQLFLRTLHFTSAQIAAYQDRIAGIEERFKNIRSST